MYIEMKMGYNAWDNVFSDNIFGRHKIKLVYIDFITTKNRKPVIFIHVIV